jgi:hypothetical protein
MPRRKQPAEASGTGLALAKILAEAGVPVAKLVVERATRAEMASWDLHPSQEDLAVRSPTFKELMRQVVAVDAATTDRRESRFEAAWRAAGSHIDAHGRKCILFGPGYPALPPCPPNLDFNLTLLWIAAGSPPDKRPDAGQADWRLEPVEDRGEGGVWGEWETAAWYAEWLCDELNHELICTLLY